MRHAAHPSPLAAFGSMGSTVPWPIALARLTETTVVCRTDRRSLVLHVAMLGSAVHWAIGASRASRLTASPKR